jgi:hypothetical protein
MLATPWNRQYASAFGKHLFDKQWARNLSSVMVLTMTQQQQYWFTSATMGKSKNVYTMSERFLYLI